MSVVPDHPDIEELPDVLEGIPVRESIRQLFRDAANGTPDNISKAGCLALARLSNDLGAQQGKGYVVWNAWREVFPVTVKNQAVFSGDARDSYLQRFRYQNVTDFTNVKTENGLFLIAQLNRQFTFDKFKFGSFARFDESEWEGISFDFAQWGEGSTFFGTSFGQSPSFQYCYWGDKTRFDGASWGLKATFLGANWGHSCSFIGASWASFPIFIFCSWLHSADFTDSTIGWEANFSGAFFGKNCLFENVKFEAAICFNSWSLEEIPIEYKKFILNNKKYTVESGNFESIRDISFGGSSFSGVDFSGRQFSGNINFGYPLKHSAQKRIKLKKDARGQIIFSDNPGSRGLPDWEYEDLERRPITTFSAPPVFHDCTIGQGFHIHEDIEFPQPSFNRRNAADAYRALKLAFSKQQAIREEQRFFKLEMEEETLRETGLKRWLFKAYKRFSDYGFSITRPLKYGGLGVLALTLVYGILSWLGQCGLNMEGCRFAPEWLEFSLLQTLPLPGLDKMSEAASKKFWPDGAWWGLVLSIMVIIHKILSLAALFLIGLALRNLFKLK